MKRATHRQRFLVRFLAGTPLPVAPRSWPTLAGTSPSTKAVDPDLATTPRLKDNPLLAKDPDAKGFKEKKGTNDFSCLKLCVVQ